VLSTLHTNDSVSSITRLLDLGVPAYLIASSITGVLAQRLVRRLCNCRKKVPATAEYIAKLERLGVTDTNTFDDEFHSVGCAVCENTGFKGRIGIYELLVIEGPIRDAIHGARAEDILSTARASGFRTMQEDALQKVKDGLTSLQEVRRVVPFDAPKLERCESCGREIMSAFAYCPFCSTVRRSVTGPFVHR